MLWNKHEDLLFGILRSPISSVPFLEPSALVAEAGALRVGDWRRSRKNQTDKTRLIITGIIGITIMIILL